MTRRVRRRSGLDSGASAVEYALVLAGLAGVVVVMVFLFGQFVSGSLVTSCETLEASIRQGTDCTP